MRITAILTVRNEGAFLLEWLAHHRAAGVTNFLVYSNNCQDGTDSMLDRLAEMGWLTHERNDGPYDKRGIQFTALKAAEKHPLVTSADWLLPLDVDEFVNIHTGDHTVPALINALPEATAITLTWRLFGNAGQIRFHDSPITETFTQAAPQVLHWPWRAVMFKTLYRNDGSYKKLGVHRPRQPGASADIKWFDGCGRELGPAFRAQRLFSDYGQSNYDLVQLNHYPLGAMESYVLKSDRGRAVHEGEKLAMDYWVERNFCTDEDTSIQTMAAPRKHIQATLMQDQTLENLHKSSVEWRVNRFHELMLEEPNRALFSRLLMTPPTRPIPEKLAKTLQAYGRRAFSKRQQ